MHKMTESDLSAAFAGESMAHMRYTIFAERAEEEGYANIARLFRGIAYAERAHARNHLEALEQIRGSADNLQVAIDGETYEKDEMYPAYFEVAKLQKEKGAQRSIVYALRAEEVHAGLYSEAKRMVDGGRDWAIGPVAICSVCGHTIIGDAPDRCPVCGQPGTVYRKF